MHAGVITQAAGDVGPDAPGAKAPAQIRPASSGDVVDGEAAREAVQEAGREASGPGGPGLELPEEDEAAGTSCLVRCFAVLSNLSILPYALSHAELAPAACGSD